MEIKTAMAGKWPDWRVQARNDVVSPLRYDGSKFTPLAPNRQAVLIYVSEEKYGPEVARWIIAHLSDPAEDGGG